MAQGGSPALHQILNAFATFLPDRIVGQGGDAVGSGRELCRDCWVLRPAYAEHCCGFP